ncbi:CHASE2 domain-containing protein [Anabaena sp. UHCC 0399]|uniref:CHASE2 domain-containing protein n=1 Tax=Anabaena sp. UHCC 0399 TaxID=3110238 RepID=UPI002B221102|nr:CHASE2 domain-containing protein [Anabaena sp. UHCC 0399]MEA5567871.1 CHASE2 domain-containing protein [Anabaena sp. UHCC 0399]
MSQKLRKRLVKLILGLKASLSRVNRELIITSGVVILVLCLRYLGLLQSLELAVLDQFFQLRPHEPPNHRITIVTIDETSLREGFPIPDVVIAELLQKLQAHQPRAIGLDIYRDVPIKNGHAALVAAYKSMPNLIGIELLSSHGKQTVLPPPDLNRQQVGFNNILYDPDGKVRRSLLYWHIDNNLHESFALKLALLYLKSEGIIPQGAASNPKYLQLGKKVFKRFQENDGAYVRSDAKGYQILSNFPKPGCNNTPEKSCGYRQISMADVLADRVPTNLIKDRIVLIGSTASSLQEVVFIPYSSGLMTGAKPVPGIVLQAYFVDQLISAALDGRPLLKVWPDFWEYLWIFAWSYIGTATKWRIWRPLPRFLHKFVEQWSTPIRNLPISKNAGSVILYFTYMKSAVSVILSCLVLIIGAYLAFLSGWWIPLIPPLLTFSGSVIWITYHLAHMQEELKRSREFLQQVINTIADPIFVKNEQRQWIVLNQAYCEFIGHPDTVLIDQSDVDFFPKHEADIFREQDELVLLTQLPQENEEEFTDAYGKTHLIATKRSLHKDAAGNFFLVGVIRDITQRKLMEDELRRTAAELFRSNSELKLKEDRLRYLAYHDSLTGLPNRKFFAEQLQESIDWAHNNHLLLGILFLDLDGFKQVNDTLGHEIGDRLLVTIGQRLSNSLRASDTVSRLGGDEFTVLLRAIPNEQVADKVAEKILASISEPIVLAGYTTKVSASIGISIYPVTGQDADTLLKQADAAMYRAKNLGKNRYEFF